LRRIAPVTAIRGNVDTSGVCGSLPPTDLVEIGGRLFYLVHALAALDITPQAAGVSAVVYGHSHRAQIREQAGVLYLNPGSAGPRRFNLPITLARIELARDSMQAQIVPLDKP
jgi:predicted phosphodiesterase